MAWAVVAAFPMYFYINPIPGGVLLTCSIALLAAFNHLGHLQRITRRDISGALFTFAHILADALAHGSGTEIPQIIQVKHCSGREGSSIPQQKNNN